MMELGFMLGMIMLNKHYLWNSMFFLAGMFMINYEWDYNISYMGMDIISWSIMTLTIWIISLSMLATNESHKLSVVILLIMYMCLSTYNLMIFYINFELILIPLYLMIILDGMNQERLMSAMYMMMYTMIGSIPLLISIIKMKSMNYFFVIHYSEPIMWVIVLAFLVKLPMFFLHLWLPKAHVEAPVNGSMILAGIVLKLGGYGLIRLLGGLHYEKNTFISIGIWGSMIMSFMCLREIDMKKLVAYSSVHHMSLMMASMMTKSSWGIYGAIMMMISHGLFSSGLFYMTNSIYSRVFTRNIMMVKGLMNLSPSFSLFWFMMILGNMGSPPFVSFIGEIILMISIMQYKINIIMFILFFLSVSYSMNLYLNISYGNMINGLFINMLPKEINVIILHLIPSILLMLKLSILV